MGTLSGHFGRNTGRKNERPHSPLVRRVFQVSNWTIFFFGELLMWMFHIGRARHPGPGQLSVEFVNVGGWLTSGDLALDSCAQFLTAAGIIPSRARSFCHHLRKSGYQSFSSPACQDQVAGERGREEGSCWGWGCQSWWCSCRLAWFCNL